MLCLEPIGGERERAEGRKGWMEGGKEMVGRMPAGRKEEIKEGRKGRRKQGGKGERER